MWPISALTAASIVVTTLYLLFLDRIMRVLSTGMAFALPSVLIWSGYAALIVLWHEGPRDYGFYARVIFLPLVGAFIVTIFGFLLASSVGGLWVRATWHGR